MGVHTVFVLLLVFSVVSIMGGVVFLAVRGRRKPPQDAYECPYCSNNDCVVCNGH